MPETPVAVAVVGVGALGQHHARVYASLPGARLVGVHDMDRKRADELASRLGTRALPDLHAVVAVADAASVAVPTVDHHRVARALLEAGKHVLLEKPMTTSLAEADELIAEASRRGLVLQVGHIERFNPATEVLCRAAVRPRFIEVHRLGAFSPRSLDIDVVLDLMIHDLDIVLTLDGSDPVQVDAVGVPVLSPRVDIANARLRFASGLIANLTASRVSVEPIRKFRVFSPRTYVSADFAARQAQVYRLVDGPAGSPTITVESAGAPEEEPLARQLAAFLAAIRNGTPPLVSGSDGRRALALAHAVLGQIGTPERG
jgi:predicted dehydrogenase